MPQHTPQQLMDLKYACAKAVAAEKVTLIPAEIFVAQWYLESGCGDHCPNNNPFGIKAYPGCYGEALLLTSEWLTDAQLKEWLGEKQGRAIVLKTSLNARKSDGAFFYRVRDWFATFPSLDSAFNKRARLFYQGKYASITAKYLNKTITLPQFIRQFASIYSTSDPDAYFNSIMEISSYPEVISGLAEARRSV